MLVTTLIVGLILLWLCLTAGKLHHLSAWSASLGSVTNNDTPFVTDGVLAVSNTHTLLVDNFNAIAFYGSGATLTRARFNNAQLLQYSVPHIWPLDTAATPPDIPAVMDLRDNPLELPVNEEIILELSTSAVGPAQTSVVAWLAAPNWTRQLSTYQWRGVIRATATTPAGAAGAWSVEAPLVFERGLRNGVYEVWACEVFQATGFAFRLRFPDTVLVSGKQLRPGGLVQTAVGNDPWNVQRGERGGLGIWGRFFSLAPPLLQMFSDAAGGTAEVRLHVGYIGQDRNMTFSVPGGTR